MRLKRGYLKSVYTLLGFCCVILGAVGGLGHV